MARRSDQEAASGLRDKVIGLGEHSVRKNYYPVLQQRISDLQRFRALLDGSSEAIFLVHVESGRIDDVNLSAARQMHCERGDLVRRPLRGLFMHEIPLEEGARTSDHLIATDLVSCNRHRIPVEVAVRFVSFEGVPYAVVVARDVTDKRAAEKSLRQAEQRYLTLLDSSPVPTAIFSSGIVRYANTAALEAVGARDLSDVQGREILEFIHPDSRELARDRARQSEAGVQLGPSVERFLTLDGRVADVEETPMPIVFMGEPAVQVMMRDITSEERAKRLAEDLRDIEESIHGCLDFDEILLTAARDSMGAVEAERAFVLVSDGGRWAVRFAPNASEVMHTKLTLEDVGVQAEELRAGHATLLDVDAGDSLPAVARFLGGSSLAAVPAIVADKPVAVLVLVWPTSTAQFADVYADFLGRVSSSVSLSLQNVHAYQAERRVADTLQEALVALPRSIKGLDFAFCYQSAADVARVGGDFFDLFELPNGRIGIVIGDVAGKGLEAAALASILKTGVRTSAYGLQGAADVMSNVNRIAVDQFEALERRFGMPLFATVFFGLLDPASRTLEYCDAGHPPPIIVPKEGHPHWLTADAPLVGANAETSFARDSVALEPDDTILLYTDGAIQVRGPRGLFGEGRLARTVGRTAGAPPEDLVGTVFETVEDYAGGRVEDNVALLAVLVH